VNAVLVNAVLVNAVLVNAVLANAVLVNAVLVNAARVSAGHVHAVLVNAVLATRPALCKVQVERACLRVSVSINLPRWLASWLAYPSPRLSLTASLAHPSQAKAPSGACERGARGERWACERGARERGERSVSAVLA